MSNSRKLFRSQVRQARKDNQVDHVNRQQRRAIAFRPKSQEAGHAWNTYLSQSSSSQDSSSSSEEDSEHGST